MVTASVFTVGHCYTRREIGAALGGSPRNTLPRIGDRIVCACFTLELCPKAPDVVLAGSGPRNELAARVFCRQKQPVPVFIKRGGGAWEYVGNYSVKRFETSKESIREHRRGSIVRRKNVSRVIFLQKHPAE